MKTLQKQNFFTLLTIIFLIGCTKSNDSAAELCATVCEHTLTAGETAATVPSSLDGTYELTYHTAQPGSPFTDGTKATFTIANNVLTVAVEGKECITIKNPVLIGTNNYKFKDSCRDNIAFNVSPNNDGSFNEVNVEPLGNGWLGQFSK